MKEQFLEPLLRRMRINKIRPHLLRYPNARLLDIGCGWEARLLKSVEPWIAAGVGIDFKAPHLHTSKLHTISARIDQALPFENEAFDLITLLAVLEHLENPVAILAECARLLKPQGSLLMTVPSVYAKPVLEFLAYRLGLVNPAEIRDHKRYYNRRILVDLVDTIEGLEIVEHHYFQFGMNNFLFAVKPA